MKELIKSIAEHLVDQPDQISVTEKVSETTIFYELEVARSDIGKIIGKGGDNIRHLSNTLGKQIRVIGAGNLEEIIYDFVAPARINSINMVYKTDG